MTHSKKIVILGHFGVGKTSLVRQFVESAFSEDYLVTVGVHVKKKTVEIESKTINLILWDIEGNTSIKKARESYLLGTHGFIYVFDVTHPETYENIANEMAFLSEKYPHIPVDVVGNKADLFTEEFTSDFFKDKHFSQCLFTSAKTGENVVEVFKKIALQTL